MAYILTSVKSTSNFLEYDHAKSLDYRSFLVGNRLKTTGVLDYQVRKQSYLGQIPKQHVIKSTGPTLFSEDLRKVVEATVPDEVEFFAANISFEDQKIEGYYAVHPLYRVECVDMSKSEYKQTNFDKNNPTYSFYYQVLLEAIPAGLNIVICDEQPRQIVISRALMDKCLSGSLKGLSFCRSLDMTPSDRSECEKT